MTGLERCSQFVDGVILRDIPAPVPVIQACERFIRDFKNPDLEFDREAAEGAVWHIERLPHTKAHWQGKPFIMQPFQCFIVCNLFGWKWTKTGFRRSSHAFLEMPRKNGKTQLAVAVALVMFGPDAEPGAEILLGATSLEHARDLLFKPAKFMVNNCDEYREGYGVEVNATTLVLPHNDSVLKTVIKKPDDGTSPYCALVDEYHLHETDDMWGVFDTGTGARPEGSLLLTTSTAGFTLDCPCYEYRDEMLKLLRGEYEDDATFAMIYEPDEGDEWTDLDVVRKVNPNLGVILSEEYLINKLNRARRSARKQNDFRTKHLSEWVGTKISYMNMVAWQRQSREMSIKDFLGEPCHVAVDMAEQKDASSVVTLFRKAGQYYVFAEHFVPESAFEWNDRYRNFALNGQINVTEGNAQDYGEIRKHIDWIAGNFRISSIRFDRWQANQMMQELMDTGLTVYTAAQGWSFYSDPMKTVETAVLDGNLFHSGDPVLTWMVGNTAAKTNEDQHMRPVKGNANSPRCKIDGCVAMIMAMKGYQDDEEPQVNVRVL